MARQLDLPYGENKRKFGWVEGYQVLSTNPQDIEIGGRYAVPC